jgi:hypothetical protein
VSVNPSLLLVLGVLTIIRRIANFVCLFVSNWKGIPMHQSMRCYEIVRTSVNVSINRLVEDSKRITWMPYVKWTGCSQNGYVFRPFHTHDEGS